MTKEITGMKCGDCIHGINLFFYVYCPNVDYFLRKNTIGCLSWMRKLSARERRECLTK